MGDRIMLEAIFRNLANQCHKIFTTRRKNKHLGATGKEALSMVEVADNGIGMTKEQIDKVLNNGGFTSRGTANEKGAGIGMTLVREFTAIHKGTLDI